MIQLHKFDDDVNHFHSSGYAEAAHGQSIGAASVQSYRQRLHIERNRQHVNRYGHSHLGRPSADFRAQDQQADDVNLRTRLSTGQSRPSGGAAPRPGGFREPQGRGYNPYS